LSEIEERKERERKEKEKAKKRICSASGRKYHGLKFDRNKCVEYPTCGYGTAMPVYDEDEIDTINKAKDDDHKRKVAVWKHISKKKRSSKTEPRRSTVIVQEYACFAF